MLSALNSSLAPLIYIGKTILPNEQEAPNDLADRLAVRIEAVLGLGPNII
jgi:hypothetical protein